MKEKFGIDLTTKVLVQIWSGFRPDMLSGYDVRLWSGTSLPVNCPSDCSAIYSILNFSDVLISSFCKISELETEIVRSNISVNNYNYKVTKDSLNRFININFRDLYMSRIELIGSNFHLIILEFRLLN